MGDKELLAAAIGHLIGSPFPRLGCSSDFVFDLVPSGSFHTAEFYLHNVNSELMSPALLSLLRDQWERREFNNVLRMLVSRYDALLSVGDV